MPKVGMPFSISSRGGLDGVVARLRIARAVGQEDAVRVERQRVGRGRLRRHHGDLAAALGQHAQDVALDAVVEGDDVVFGIVLLAVAAAQLPLGFGEVVGLLDRHDLGQVHAGQARERARQFERLRFVRLVALGAGDDGAGLGALLAQEAGQLAGIDAGDRDDVLGLQVVGQRLGGAEVRCQQRQVADDQACGVDFGRFDVFGVDAVVADVRVRQGDDLTRIAGVGEDFLIAGDAVLNTTSPVVWPAAPMDIPRKIVPSARARMAGTAGPEKNGGKGNSQ